MNGSRAVYSLSIRYYVDVALDVKDRKWFEELTSELRRIQEVEG